MSEQIPSAEELTVGQLLRARCATIATAESCTGGLLGSMLTDVSGSSDYYVGGVIAYTNQVKCDVLGVNPETLSSAGAVSRETAMQMARGVRRLLGSDYALSTTGIAGPTGGTTKKPVGLIYVALAGPSGERCEQHIWDQDRIGNKTLSARRALEMLVEHLTEQDRG